MKYFNGILLALLFISFWSACKEDDLNLESVEDSYRIRKIIETDNLGEEVNWDLFTYEADKLVLWQHFHKAETGEMVQDWKIEARYNGNNIITTMSYLRNGIWSGHQECDFTIDDNCVLEKSISRLNFPECDNCWRYDYHYRGNKLVGWDKFLKAETGEWVHIRKVSHIYNDNKLIEYRDSVNFDNTELKLDYKKIYSYNNDKLAGWIGGIYIENYEWKPTQKVDYAYEGNTISTKVWLRWKETDSSWVILGSVSYYYDGNNKLTEETTSLGVRRMYEYEIGKGNTALIYCAPDENEENEPVLKNSFSNSFSN